MVNWKHKLPLKDIWEWYESADNGDAPEIGKRVAARLKEQPWFESYDELEDIAVRFEDVEDIEEFDEVLADLYDWADEEHRCWVKTF